MQAKVSRVKTDALGLRTLLEKACNLAANDGRPFTIKCGYDRSEIGSYVEYTIWYEERSK